MTERSSVLRVYFSNVRMPRSQKMTFSLPPAMMYSADMIHSSMVFASPRFRSTGFFILPTAFSSWKFCMLRAPICTRSTYSSNSSMRSSLISSLTMGRPVASRALTMSRMPSVPRPWNAYGDVRGLYAPPRSMLPPAAFTSRATCTICSSPSTLHGPPITTIFSLPPTFTPATSTIVSASWNRRFAFLYGSDTRCTFSTYGFARMLFSSRIVVSPTRPNTL